MSRSIALCLITLALIPVFGSAGSAQDADAEDDRRCLDYGTTRGTQAYVECRVTLERRSDEARPAPYGGRIAPPAGEQTISDGLALSECERRARQVAPYPIKRRATSFVFPGREKRASLSFEINKPGSSSAFWNVDCKFAGNAMTDFSAR
ncbi:hypothetical protein [Methylobacterium sp. 77]|uniref:hypothetical protein n=1 Tax=Methylobacterium sp. 77 TaxID=1101192 RepID=UPI0003A6B88F|nr:hypothetical protein [Methylobacterium sp. 77]